MKRVPHEFVLESLVELVGEGPDAIYTKPMFGALGVYYGDKIVIILREKGVDRDDGVWIATTSEYHASLKQDFPTMRSIEIFGPGPTGWQILPVDAPDFEESALKLTERIAQADPRIGKIPAKKRLNKKNHAKNRPAKKMRPKPKIGSQKKPKIKLSKGRKT